MAEQPTLEERARQIAERVTDYAPGLPFDGGLKIVDFALKHLREATGAYRPCPKKIDGRPCLRPEGHGGDHDA